MSDNSNQSPSIGRMIERMRAIESENEALRRRLSDGEEQTRELVALDGAVDAPFEVPPSTIFVGADRFGDHFSPNATGDIAVAVEGLVDKNWPALGELAIAVRWARKGGEDHGRPRVARVRILAGEVRHAFRADLLLTVAWDWFRVYAPTLWQVERIIDRELRRVSVTSNDKGLKLSLREPDFMAYLDEIEDYGVWDLFGVRAAETFAQMPLWDVDPGVFLRDPKITQIGVDVDAQQAAE